MATQKSYAGTPLESEDLKSGKVVTVRYKPQARYAWAAGAGIGRYLAELKRGRLVGRRCDKCDKILVPPRMFCEVCFRPTTAWVELKDSGTVNTFAISYLATDASRIKEPQIPAVIEIDGASPGHGILHLLGEVDPKAVRVGMRVKAVWKPEAERTGAITDIRYFRPVKAPKGV